MGVWVRSPPPAHHFAHAPFVPRAVLRHAVFGAARLDLAGTIPIVAGTHVVHASFVPKAVLRYAVFGAARLDLAGTFPFVAGTHFAHAPFAPRGSAQARGLRRCAPRPSGPGRPSIPQRSACRQYSKHFATSLTASDPCGIWYSSSIVAGIVHLFFCTV